MLDDLIVDPSDSLPMLVLVLDEIDCLGSTAGKEILYKLFEWPCLELSRLVLIGIANALDLTKRILPRLAAKNCMIYI